MSAPRWVAITPGDGRTLWPWLKALLEVHPLTVVVREPTGAPADLAASRFSSTRRSATKRPFGVQTENRAPSRATSATGASRTSVTPEIRRAPFSWA